MAALAAAAAGVAAELELAASDGSGQCAEQQEFALRLQATQEALNAEGAAMQDATADALREGAVTTVVHMLNTKLRQQLAPATALGALLQEHFERPQQQAVVRLELARIAATRSCAYLRCSNLAAGGGPAAGEGDGSKKCSACRAVWYCGECCSHADWRAGHRRVCKALAAERQAAKEQQQRQ
jgi:hypothetical protein